jgi:hypothetical protein
VPQPVNRRQQVPGYSSSGDEFSVDQKRPVRVEVFPRRRRTLTMFILSKEDSRLETFTYASAQRCINGAGA